MRKIYHKVRDKKVLPNGAVLPSISWSICEEKKYNIKGDKLNENTTFVARFYHGKTERKHSCDMNICLKFVKDLTLKYKYQITGTMIYRKMKQVVDEIEKVIENTNVMLPKPMEGCLTDKDGKGLPIVYLTGINNKVIFYKDQDGVEHEVNTLYDELFSVFDVMTVAKFCDKVTSVY